MTEPLTLRVFPPFFQSIFFQTVFGFYPEPPDPSSDIHPVAPLPGNFSRMFLKGSQQEISQFAEILQSSVFNSCKL